MIKIRRTWDINPKTRVVPNKKKKKSKNKKSEERYLIIDALEEMNEEKLSEESTGTDTTGAA